MTPFAIAGIQMHLSAVHENIGPMHERLSVLMSRFPWVQMVVFSELSGYGLLPDRAQPLPGPGEQIFQEWAVKYGIWLIPGSMFEASDDKIYNTASVIAPDGTVVGRYRKMFPFRPYEIGITAGDQFLVFDVPNIGRFGVSICYDMWFPETSRTMAAMGAEVILHPTLTDTIDRDVELSIARATAATNQCYFFDINGLGGGGNGRSIVIGPSGNVIHEAYGGEELIPVEIYLDRVRRDRETGIRGLGQPLKSFRERPVRFDIYQQPGSEMHYLNSLGPLTVPTRKTGDSGATPPVVDLSIVGS